MNYVNRNREQSFGAPGNLNVHLSVLIGLFTVLLLGHSSGGEVCCSILLMYQL